MGFILWVVVILIATSCVTNIPQKEKLNLEGYEITFFDDFDGDELDTTYWRFFNGKVRGREQYLDHNYRGGFYTTESDVIYVKNGALHISTQYKKEGKYGEGWYSSWIESSKGEDEIRGFDEFDNYVGFSQKYGYFEARCIAPPAEGVVVCLLVVA